MTSMEALEDLKQTAIVTIRKLFYPVSYIANKDIEDIEQQANTIKKDLELLKIVKKIVQIVDYSTYPITSPKDQLFLLSGGEIKNKEDYDRIKEWIEEE